MIWTEKNNVWPIHIYQLLIYCLSKFTFVYVVYNNVWTLYAFLLYSEHNVKLYSQSLLEGYSRKKVVSISHCGALCFCFALFSLLLHSQRCRCEEMSSGDLFQLHAQITQSLNNHRVLKSGFSDHHPTALPNLTLPTPVLPFATVPQFTVGNCPPAWACVYLRGSFLIWLAIVDKLWLEQYSKYLCHPLAANPSSPMRYKGQPGEENVLLSKVVLLQVCFLSPGVRFRVLFMSE